MDAAKKKALYRAKLKDAAQKREKRIDSPLVRYNESDQPVCRVCDVVLKSESLWAAHQASRKHHDAIKNVKANATGLAQKSEAKSAPPVEVANKARTSSSLPEGFFDKQDTKRPKHGMGTGAGQPEYAAHEASVKSMSSGITGKTSGKMGPPALKSVRGALPEGFFDDKQAPKAVPPEVTKGLPKGFFDNENGNAKESLSGSESMAVKGALPDGFFDNNRGHTTKSMDASNVKQAKGALPEGFFDNKDADLRARGIEPVKVDIKDEYKEFEKLIREDLQEVDERLEEEEIDAADIRDGEESLEQKAYRERVEMLKKKQLELKAARFGQKKGEGVTKESSDEESSSDEDDDEGNFAVDWRAKRY